VAAAAVLDLGSTYPGVDDSKKLSPEARGRAALLIKERAVAWAVAAKTPAEVDSLNPLMASMLAMAEAFSSLPAKPGLALADGNAAPPVSGARVVTVVRGDARSLSIAAASILAKTARDAMMEELDRLYPLYGFARHKGYGTREHLEAIARHGPSPAHRLSFRGAGGPAGPKGPSGSKGRGGAGGQGGTEGPDGTEWSRGGLF
jgi:ribonuclease HII